MPKRTTNFDGLVQDCGNSNPLAMELLQSYTKPSILIQFFILAPSTQSRLQLHITLTKSILLALNYYTQS